MKPESQAFTSKDVPFFLDQLLEIEMRQTADRIRAASRRMEELAARIPDERSDGGPWTAKEVLAHIFVLSRAYGVFAYLVARGRVSDINLGDVISQRDVVGDETAQLPVAEIVAAAKKQHDRTLAFMAKATVADYKATATTELGELRVENLLRLPLLIHLEDHLDQIEQILAGDPAAAAASG